MDQIADQSPLSIPHQNHRVTKAFSVITPLTFLGVLLLSSLGTFSQISLTEILTYNQQTLAHMQLLKKKSTRCLNPVSAKRPAILERVGFTRLLPIHFEEEGCTIYAKAEFENGLAGSSKDRLIIETLEVAYASGELVRGRIILEVTSGNTGIAGSQWANLRGFPITLFMGKNASRERIRLLRELGADLRLFDPGNQGYQKGLELRDRLVEQHPGRYWTPNQFFNQSNPDGHEATTGAELIAQLALLDLTPTAFVAAVGTGGTISGVSAALLKNDPETLIAPVMAKPCPHGLHFVEGIVSGSFVAPFYAALDPAIRANELHVSSCDAFAMCERLFREHALQVGPSSGLNLAAALRLAQQLGPESVVTTVLCDGWANYPSNFAFSKHA